MKERIGSLRKYKISKDKVNNSKMIFIKDICYGVYT